MASLVFPRNLSSYGFWFTFNFYSYNVPNAGGQSSGSSVVLNPLGTVRLPMPNSMVDHQDVFYAVEEIGVVAGAALAKFQNSGSWKDAGAAGLKAGTAQGAVNILPGGTAGGGNIFLQTQGLAVNPFLSVMFKSPAFKKHAFKWLLAPANGTETIDLQTIIDTFRYNQLPAASSAFAGILLAYPNIVQVTVSGSSLPGTNNSAFSYTFKPAVIESFAVNFTPGGQPSFFGETGGTTMAEITMSLLEIEYWLQNDYPGNPTARGIATAANLEQELENFKNSVGSIFGLTPTANNGGPAPLNDPNNIGLF